MIMSESKLREFSIEFSVDIIEFVKYLKSIKEAIISNRIGRSGTSYWLKLMCETKRIDVTTYQCAEKLCGNIRRLLIASCKTAKENTK